jgi:hypothetical protein
MSQQEVQRFLTVLRAENTISLSLQKSRQQIASRNIIICEPSPDRIAPQASQISGFLLLLSSNRLLDHPFFYALCPKRGSSKDRVSIAEQFEKNFLCLAFANSTKVSITGFTYVIASAAHGAKRCARVGKVSAPARRQNLPLNCGSRSVLARHTREGTPKIFLVGHSLRLHE